MPISIHVFSAASRKAGSGWATLTKSAWSRRETAFNSSHLDKHKTILSNIHPKQSTTSYTHVNSVTTVGGYKTFSRELRSDGIAEARTYKVGHFAQAIRELVKVLHGGGPRGAAARLVHQPPGVLQGPLGGNLKACRTAQLRHAKQTLGPSTSQTYISIQHNDTVGEWVSE